MSVLAATTSPTFAAALVGAGGLVGAALIAGWFQLRAQSAQDQLDAIDRITRKYTDQIIDELARHLDATLDARARGLVIGEILKRALREVLNESGPGPNSGRRWYDRE